MGEVIEMPQGLQEAVDAGQYRVVSPEELTPEQQANVRLQVHMQAHSLDDEWAILDALGIM